MSVIEGSVAVFIWLPENAVIGIGYRCQGSLDCQYEQVRHLSSDIEDK